VTSTRYIEAHLVGTISSEGVTMWHSLVDGKRVEGHAFAVVESKTFKRGKHSK
jgi:hypothetical protein